MSASLESRTAEPFLFNPSNRAFVEGHAQNIATSSVWPKFIVILLGTMLAVFVILYPEWSTQRAISAQGHETQGQVTAHRTYVTTSKNNTTTHYMVTVTFTATAGGYEGQPFAFEQDVGGSAYDQLAIGSTVPLSFLPDSPTTARLAGGYTNDIEKNFVVPLAIISFALLLVLVLLYMRAKQRIQRLVKTGHLITGEIVQCTGRKMKNYYSITLKYTLRSPTRQILIGKENIERRDLLIGSPLPQAGTPVTVLYADDRTYRVM